MISASGIRDIFEPEAARGLFFALGHVIGKGLDGAVALGRDSRPSGQPLSTALLDGLVDSGLSPRYSGLCTVPVMAHAVRKGYASTAIMVTASHNPPEWNGLKVYSGDGMIISEGELRALVERARAHEVAARPSPLTRVNPYPEDTSLLAAYVKDMLDIATTLGAKGRQSKVIVDAGNGPSALTVPRILMGMGCRVEVLNPELDGSFRRPIEPLPENLMQLCEVVPDSGADLGVGFDCDGDRAVLVAEDGQVLREDDTLALAVDYYLSISAKDIVVNRATSLLLDHVCASHGVQLIRAGVGERMVAERMIEVGANIGGEGSNGGIMMPSFSLARDGALALVLILAFLRREGVGLSELVKGYPRFNLRRAKLRCNPDKIAHVLQRVREAAESLGAVDVADDIRVSGLGWWALVRPSRTEPIIRVLSEAASEEEAEARMRLLVEVVQEDI